MYPKLLTLILSILIASLIQSCGSGALKPAKYVQYIRDAQNGFKVTQEIPGISAETFYEPPVYVSLTKLDPQHLDTTGWYKSVAENENFLQFTWSLQATGNTAIDKVLFGTAVKTDSLEWKRNQLMYQMQDRFSLVTDTDSLPCIFYLMQANGRIDDAYHATIVFESKERLSHKVWNKNIRLIFNDPTLLHNRLEFVFDKDKLNKQPELQL